MAVSKKVRMVIYVIYGIAIVMLLAQLTSTNLEMSRYNYEWNGTSRFFELLEEHHGLEVPSPESLRSVQADTLLILEPEEPFSDETIAAYQGFLSRGGTIIIAGERDATNRLLESLGSSSRTLKGTLCSVDTGYSTPFTPIAYRVPIEDGIGMADRMILNRPVGVTGPEVIMETSLLSWRDLDDDGRIGGGETIQTYPVLVRESLHNGTLYLLGDGSLFINGMLEGHTAAENGKFIGAILEGRPAMDQIVSLTRRGDGLLPLFAFIKSTYMAKMALVSVTVLLTAFLWWRREARDEGEEDGA
ncbi:MAG: DUF4350 domain-containing protein [Methanomicrobiales archaeon]|nr:DUF4350 domain-containing protein [Methanomicrobiales archaeon]